MRVRRGTGVSVVELAAFLSLTPGRVRAIISQAGLQHTGKDGPAKLYDAQEFFRHTDARDRKARLN